MNVEIGKELLKMIIEGWIKMSELRGKSPSNVLKDCTKSSSPIIKNSCSMLFFSVIMIHSCLEIILCFAFSFSKSGLEL